MLGIWPDWDSPNTEMGESQTSMLLVCVLCICTGGEGSYH